MCKHLIIPFLIIIVVINLNGQESCVFNTTLSGECLHIQKCDYALELLRKRRHPQICSFENHYPIVCCPKSEIVTKSNIYGKIAKEKCEEIKSNYEYQNYGFVIGGVNAKSEEYVHMAALGFGDYQNVQWLCGGSLISDKFILTAAHCLATPDYGPVRWVRLGDLDLNSTEDEAEPFDFGIKTIIKHPDYKPPSKYNDIALIELERPVRYTKYIKPACIETNEKIDNKTFLYATGWGIVDAENSRLSHLQEVLLMQYTHEECRKAYGTNNKRRLRDGIVKTQLCAGGRGELKDTCNGDSGGPLQYTTKEKGQERYRGYTVVGVTSFGKICGLTRSPGVYTKVSQYVPWIESIVWPNAQ